MNSDNEHECVFVEEQEPNGRLILPPCIVCDFTAMDALAQFESDLRIARYTTDEMASEIVAAFKLLGVEEPDADDNLPRVLAAHLRGLVDE